jgi:hypothetical protein
LRLVRGCLDDGLADGVLLFAAEDGLMIFQGVTPVGEVGIVGRDEKSRAEAVG